MYHLNDCMQSYPGGDLVKCKMFISSGAENKDLGWASPRKS